MVQINEIINPKTLPKDIKLSVIKAASGKMGTIDSMIIKKQPKSGPQIPSMFIIISIKSLILLKNSIIIITILL